ncbi:YggT family protein [Blastochloris sulfoviridis]|uniref:YggT family protein n=1 Tax=Blastochloris sulfoviridis TaxID=50712 RepID=A0A5M6I3R9_9HYPH|nr:YggT family protein [Blastochloris sulfoviridis]KAA5602856.1 YggT family protein [Blastochloris sulfoviridis]
MATGTIFAHWYFHLPNFLLAALFYTLLGRVLLGLVVDADSRNYIWRFFCRVTGPVVTLVGMVTPRAAPPILVWLFALVWLFLARVALYFALATSGLLPAPTPAA